VLPGLLKTVRMFHGGTLLLRFLLLSLCLAPYAVGAQCPAASDTRTRPAILGSLGKGKYSNHVIGFEIQLDPICTVANCRKRLPLRIVSEMGTLQQLSKQRVSASSN
jgi:hypothetical protein